MQDLNVVVVSGNLTTDPQKGVNCVRYTLANHSRYQGKDYTSFIPCTVFGFGAEFAEKYLKKGMFITVKGYLDTYTFKNQAGETRTRMDVVVDQQEISKSARRPQDDNETPDFPEDTGEADIVEESAGVESVPVESAPEAQKAPLESGMPPVPEGFTLA